MHYWRPGTQEPLAQGWTRPRHRIGAHYGRSLVLGEPQLSMAASLGSQSCADAAPCPCHAAGRALRGARSCR